MDPELNQEWLSTLSDLKLAGRVSFKRCYAEGLGGTVLRMRRKRRTEPLFT